MNRAQVRLHRAGVPVCMQWHDSFTAEADESRALETAGVMRDIMEDSVPELGGVSFPVDVKIGYNLGKKTRVNPRGLEDM